MATTQVKVFSGGRWVDFGDPRPYHAAVALVAELAAAGVRTALTR